ncbi:MAG: aspartate dehydrogenase [Rhodobacterales bacterium]|nr:aspartate dehydrogenase [Rhodobacterales bacterium]
MRVGLIGYGAIAQHVAQGLGALDARLTLALIRPGRAEAARAALGVVRCTDHLDGELPYIMVDCAGHAGLAQHGPQILRAGVPLITVSLGALADPALEAELTAAARDGDTRLILCSGAIGGLDALRAARMGRLTRVTYEGRKPPAGWRGSRAEDVMDLSAPLTQEAVHFDGDARQAARLYPKNANVAAAVALAGLGFEETGVRLIADPAAAGNIHTVTAQGDFGEMRFSITGQTLPGNPRTSALAAMSVLSALADHRARIRF